MRYWHVHQPGTGFLILGRTGNPYDLSLEPQSNCMTTTIPLSYDQEQCNCYITKPVQSDGISEANTKTQYYRLGKWKVQNRVVHVGRG